ncbi:MAG: hypothetical protein HUU55_15840 [Myxococcales bacterium]|nr:hypothetical protein [Myxococcales bacterium]
MTPDHLTLLRSVMLSNSESILQLRCSGCGANLSTAAEGVAGNGTVMLAHVCPFCESANVAPSHFSAQLPDVVLAFGIGADQAKEAVRRYLRSRPLAPRREVLNALPERFRGIYVPAYLYSATARCAFSATIIESYVTTEKDPQTQENKSVSHSYPVEFQGETQLRVRDIVVSASNSVSDTILETLKPFDLRLLRRYSPSLLLGFWAEQHAQSIADRKVSARRLADEVCTRQAVRFLPGDDQKNVVCNVVLEDEAIDPVLLPVWQISIPVGPNKHAVVYVNGQTGLCCGEVPASPWSVFWGVMGFVVFILAVISIIYGIYVWV